MTSPRPTRQQADSSRRHASASDSPDSRATTDRQQWTTCGDSGTLLLEASIARLSNDELSDMSRDDLMDVIRLATSSLPQQDCLEHLPYMSLVQLQQLASLARHSCRLQNGMARIPR